MINFILLLESDNDGYDNSTSKTRVLLFIKLGFQTKMMSLNKTGFDEKEYTALSGKIDLLLERM